MHGRLTVDNVLYDASGEPVLTDFWLGGPEAPAPEDDVGAFAALFGEALAGRDVSPGWPSCSSLPAARPRS